MMRLLCTLGCVAVTLLAAPSSLAQDAGDEDAGDAGFDAGELPEEDAGFDDAGFDAGEPLEDAGEEPEEPEEDAGPPPIDAGEPPLDAGQPPIDAGPPPIDSGQPPVDAGQPPADAGPPPVDAGDQPSEPGSDAGPSTPSDAGLEPPDAGPHPPFDAGRPGDECSPRCLDERRAGRCSSSGLLVPIACADDEACEVDQCVPAALAGTTGCACRQGGTDTTTIALFTLLLGARLLRRRARGRGEGVIG